MVDSTEAAILRSARQRPLVLCGVLTPFQQESIRKWVKGIESSRWVPGDESAHAWQECLLERPELTAILAEVPFVARLSKRADRLTAWVNWFAQGQWIGKHRDADGDVQLIVPIELPQPGQGGDLWIENAGNTVPLGLRDVLAFNAALHPHGTTSLKQTESTRTTLNIRLWLRKTSQTCQVARADPDRHLHARDSRQR